MGAGGCGFAGGVVRVGEARRDQRSKDSPVVREVRWGWGWACE